MTFCHTLEIAQRLRLRYKRTIVDWDAIMHPPRVLDLRT